MTWIIGCSTIFGYSVLLSDICVTLNNKKTIDCLQKVYPVGRFIAAGFAGSIELGFKLLDNLQHFLILPDKDKDCSWKPLWVADNWHSIAKEIFNKEKEELKQLGSHIIIAGCSPKKNLGDAPIPESHVIKLCSPDFVPQEAKRGEVISIGSGTDIKEYGEILKNVSWNISLMQMEVGMPGGYARALLPAITDALKKQSVKGISKHLHICLSHRNKILIGNNNHETFPSGSDSLPARFEMPKVATNWQELLEYINKMDETSARAIC